VDDLRSKLESDVGSPVALRYKQQDGSWLSVRSNHDLAGVMESHRQLNSVGASPNGESLQRDELERRQKWGVCA
jgi:hypothetical protein